LSMMLRRNNNTIPPHFSLVALAPPAPMTRHRLLHYTHGSPYPWASTWPCHVECCSSLCPYPKSTHRPHLFTTLLLSGPRVSFGPTLEWGWRLKAMGKSRLPARSSRPVLFIYVLTCSGLDLFFMWSYAPPWRRLGEGLSYIFNIFIFLHTLSLLLRYATVIDEVDATRRSWNTLAIISS
jgi:hypothetical protein